MTAFSSVVSALSDSVLIKLAWIVPKDVGVTQVIILSISPITCTLNVLLELALSSLSLYLVARIVNS